jgi:hypothetical protein
MIDALGYQEARDPGFLSLLDRPRAPVRSVLGYSSAAIPTLMTGRSACEHGQFSMYARANRSGIFRPLAPILSIAPRLTGRTWMLRRWITRYLHWRGITGYFSLYNIPLSLLAEFDLCQRKDIYAPRAFSPGEGLADALVGQGRIWSWRTPEETSWAEMRAEIEQGDARVLWIYTAALDSLMHANGPESEATRRKLRAYDQIITGLIQAAQKRSREVRVFVFGDHGMAPVSQAHDLWGPLDALGLRVPNDYLFFLDSTMARFWFRSAGARRTVEELLRGLEYGRILEDEELAALGVLFPQREYGECIFQLREGAILVPSFMSTEPVRGMHGYHPDDRCSYTTLLTNVKDGPYPTDLVSLHQVLRQAIREE